MNAEKRVDKGLWFVAGFLVAFTIVVWWRVNPDPFPFIVKVAFYFLVVCPLWLGTLGAISKARGGKTFIEAGSTSRLWAMVAFVVLGLLFLYAVKFASS